MILGAIAVMRISASFTVVVIILSVVALAAFIWAAFIRQPNAPHKHHHRHHWRHSKHDVAEASGKEKSGFFGRKRRRRKKKKDRPANPTLAETGGLPPVRSNESEPPNN